MDMLLELSDRNNPLAGKLAAARGERDADALGFGRRCEELERDLERISLRTALDDIGRRTVPTTPVARTAMRAVVPNAELERGPEDEKRAEEARRDCVDADEYVGLI
jgi:predicted lipid carrier protein YhbT